MIGDRGNKERKQFLEKQKIINCGLCMYNRGDNKKRRGRTDRYKNINRETIRIKEVMITCPEDEIFGPYSLEEALDILKQIWGMED